MEPYVFSKSSLVYVKMQRVFSKQATLTCAEQRD